jgi:hypothetical protein
MYKFREEVNQLTGVKETYYWDDITKTMTVRNRHDVTDIIEANKRRANASVDSRFGNEFLHHFAEIPNAIIEKWLKEDGIDVFSEDPDMQKAVLKKLHDPDWRYLRSTVKKVL